MKNLNFRQRILLATGIILSTIPCWRIFEPSNLVDFLQGLGTGTGLGILFFLFLKKLKSSY